jgi:nucleotide-binding universal stress UspA family protein
VSPASDVILVGFDGSDAARAALAFGIEEAGLRGATLRIVSAWHEPLAAYMGGGFEPPGPHLDPSALEAAAHQELDEALAEIRQDPAGLEVERRVRQGRAAAVLLEEAAEAALLVVGSRGHGGFAGLMLGSVSQQCAAHAPCPVVVVHGPREAERRARRS